MTESIVASERTRNSQNLPVPRVQFYRSNTTLAPCQRLLRSKARSYGKTDTVLAQDVRRDDEHAAKENVNDSRTIAAAAAGRARRELEQSRKTRVFGPETTLYRRASLGDKNSRPRRTHARQRLHAAVPATCTVSKNAVHCRTAAAILTLRCSNTHARDIYPPFSLTS